MTTLKSLKESMAKYWWIFAIVSMVLLFLCSYIGWYVLANLTVFGGAYYVVQKALARKKRVLENKELLRRMDRKERKKFFDLDDQESRNITSSTELIFWLNVACLFLDIYIYLFNFLNNRPLSLFHEWDTNQGINLTLLITGVLFSVLFLGSWKAFLKTTKIQARPEQKKIHTSSNRDKKRLRDKTYTSAYKKSS